MPTARRLLLAPLVLALVASARAQEAVSGVGPGRDAQATVTSAQAARDRGVAWLVARQNQDGSWGTFASRRPGEIWLGTTASLRAFEQATAGLCLLALAPAAEREPAALGALARGLDRVLTTPPARRAMGEVFYDTWAHTFLVEALASLSRHPALASRREAVLVRLGVEVELLLERQSADGGWGYYDFGHSLARPSGHESTCFNTASALLALRAAAAAGVQVAPERLDAGLKTVERLRQPDGSWAYGTYIQLHPGFWPNRLKGSLARAVPCMLSLFEHQRGGVDRAELARTIERLRQNHHFLQIARGRPYPHEAWYMNAGYYVLYGRWYAARAIAALSPAEQAGPAGWLRAVTIADQSADGSWVDFPLYGYHQAYGTAFAVLTLETLDPPPPPPAPPPPAEAPPPPERK